MLAVLAMALGHGAIGLADDYIKVVLRRPLGLRAREKLLFQTLLAMGLAWAALEALGLGSRVQVPYTGLSLELGPLYNLLVLLVVLGTSNGVNLTDGADGLLGGSAVLVFGFYAVVAFLQGQAGLAVFAAAVAAGNLGFLRFNAHPAKIFMGDVGSLYLGGGLAALSVLTKTELLLPIAGALYVAETLSVILQVASFRLTGRRILRMSPCTTILSCWGGPRRRWCSGCGS